MTKDAYVKKKGFFFFFLHAVFRGDRLFAALFFIVGGVIALTYAKLFLPLISFLDFVNVNEFLPFFLNDFSRSSYLSLTTLVLFDFGRDRVSLAAVVVSFGRWPRWSRRRTGNRGIIRIRF